MGVPTDPVFELKRHATRPYLRFKVTQIDESDVESAFDFTGALTATFLLYDSDGVQKVSSGAIIESPKSSGVLRYMWQSSDTDTAGEFRAEFDVNYGGGVKLTLPLETHLMVRVYEDLNNG